MSRNHIFNILSSIILLTLIFSTMGTTSARAAGILYTRPNGNGNCSSWENACTLQTALIGAAIGDEIWVMAGTYKPTNGTDRAISFVLKNNVAVYGGFAGTETFRTQRDPASNVSILSGDIGAAGVTTDNSYHVVVGSGTDHSAILDGFTIKYGNGNGTFPNNAAGALYNDSGSPVLNNLIITDNTASGGGGGVFNYSGSNPLMSNMVFKNNTSVNGGALLNNASNPILTNVIFDSNTGHNGGAINNDNGSAPILTNITISNNTAQWGGGISNGASSPTLINVTIFGNNAVQGDGGMTNADGSSPTLTNVTFSGNTSALYGVIRNYNGSNPKIYNSILWNNSAGIFNISSITTLKDSVTQGGCPADSTCTNVIDADPKLFPLADNGGFTQTIALDFGSSAIDTGGVNSTCAATDQRGVGRVVFCDIGAFEFVPDTNTPTTVTTITADIPDPSYPGQLVNVSVTVEGSGDTPAGIVNILGASTNCNIALVSGSGNCNVSFNTTGTKTLTAMYASNSIYAGSSDTETHQVNVTTRYAKPGGMTDGVCESWINACELYYVLSTAVPGDEIWVEAGVYLPGALRTDTFQLKNGVALYGGFAGTETDRDQRQLSSNMTILSGDIDANDSQTPIITNLATVTDNTANSYHVVTGADGAILDGFTITAGNANGASPNNSGGGMYNSGSSPALTNITFSGNSAAKGGGMYNSGSSPVLTNLTFSGNSATNHGGGLYNINSSNPVLTNLTFSGNSATNYGGGMFNDGSNPQIRNTIFWGNTAASGGTQIYNYNGSTPVASDSVIQDGYTGTNIITTDPKLGTLGNYGGLTQTIPLLLGSSAINAGNGTHCPTNDQRGQARLGICDIGAYEYNYTGVYFVKPVASGAANCQTWENACALQTALANSTSGDEIWVMAGTYKPTAGTDRTATFQLKNGVALYGGFAGTETIPSQRNYTTNITILSGDLNGDDVGFTTIYDVIYSKNTENVYHVVTGATGAALDGVTIIGGNANGASPNNSGGGMYNTSSSLALTNIIFSGNSANNSNYGDGGGGMYNTGSNLALMNITFSGNSAQSGGGMNDHGISSTLTNVTFSGNSANRGGGMYNNGGSPILTNVTFVNNSILWGDNGGGGMTNIDGSPTLVNVTFSGNSSTEEGGGMSNVNGSPTLTNVTFSGNSADNDGGGMYYNSNYSSPTLTNVTFSGNSTDTRGGGIFIRGRTIPILTNVTFKGNSAGTYGGGIYNGISTSGYILQIRNTIFWGNTAPSGEAQIYNYSIAPIVSDSIVQGGYTGTNIIMADPNLGVLGNYGGLTQTIPLLPGSSAINAGNGTYCPTYDQRGEARLGACDIGAYEYNYTGVYYVKPVASGAANCQSWANACVLQSALVTAVSGDEIWVAAGTHKPGTARTNTFQLKNGVAVYGGFAGTETTRSQRNYAVNVTTLSGEIGAAGNSDNSYHVVTGATGATLDGFSITAGNANGNSPDDNGGGMYNVGSSPTLIDLTFSGNSAAGGGGMYNNSSSNPTLTNVTFSGNSAGFNGGGMYNNSNSSPTLTNVTFNSNASADYGGGMYNSGSSNPQIRNTIFWGNPAASNGAQIYNNSSVPSVSYSVVEGDYVGGTNIITEDPKLGTLGGDGIFTQVIPIQTGSSAIDTGDNTICPLTDQRGMVRPQDGNINGLAVCDIGAYEYSAVNIPPTISNITDKTIDEDTATGSIAFTIGDMETPAASLIVTASSSNTTLVPNTNITLGGSGSSRTLNIKPGSNQSGTATITVTVDDDTDTTSDTFLLTVNSINDLPTISNITDKSTNENTTTSNIAFTIDDVETSATSLTVTATSSNTTLVPNTNITLGGSGTDRTINITPASNQYGTTTITVTVDDGTDTASDTFLLTVNSVNDLPTISNITDKTTNEDTATGNISFTVGDTETPATSLTVTATSSNTTLVPNANITLSGSGTDRTINITPASNQSGTATITVTVDDGTDTASDSFVLTVNELSTNSHQLFLPLILR
jgi:predicted outer membrane repeat protein